MNKKLLTKFTPNHSDYPWKVYDLGLIKYGDALKIQQETRELIKSEPEHYLYLLEHPNVITMGRRTDPEHLLKTPKELEAAGIELFEVDRGGSTTFHGPGQLVGYLICKSSRMGGIHELVSKVLEAIAQTLRSFDLDVVVDEENPGIWTNSEVPRKLAAVGMSNSKGYTMHGFAINVDLPLTGFAAIVPCGLTLPVSTIAIESGKRQFVKDVKEKVIEEIQLVFDN